jgi:hypothetical protein
MKNAVYAAVCAVSLLGTAASAQQYDWLYGREGKAMALSHDWSKDDKKPTLQTDTVQENKPAQKSAAQPVAAKLPKNYVPGPEGRKMDAGLFLFNLFFGDNEAKQIHKSLGDTLNAKHEAAKTAVAAQATDLFTIQSAEIDRLLKAKNFNGIINNIKSRVYKSDKVLIYAIDATDEAKGPTAKIVSSVLATLKEDNPAKTYAQKWLAAHPQPKSSEEHI